MWVEWTRNEKCWGIFGLFSSQTFSRINTPTFLKPSNSSHLPAYEGGTECSETSAYKIQTPGNYPEESIETCSVFHFTIVFVIRLQVRLCYRLVLPYYFCVLLFCRAFDRWCEEWIVFVLVNVVQKESSAVYVQESEIKKSNLWYVNQLHGSLSAWGYRTSEI